MSRQYFTANPAYPHPDSAADPQPLTMAEAVAFAVRILRDPTADQWMRNKAADELQYSHEAQEEQP